MAPRGGDKSKLAASETFVEQKLDSPLKPLMWLLLPMIVLIIYGAFATH
jgi:hypothetical protein